MKRVAVAGMITCVAVAMSGCSATAEQKDAMCSSLEDLRATLQATQSFSASTTLGDIQQWGQDVAASAQEVVNSAQDYAEAGAAAAESASNEVSDAIESRVPDGDITQEEVAQTSAALSDAADNLTQKIDAALAAAGCGDSE